MYSSFDKNKYMSISNRFSRLQKVFFPLLTGVFIFSFLFYYLRHFPRKDKADVFHVKVLPSDLEDSKLHSLSKDAFSYLAVIDAGSSGCRAHVYRYGKLGSIDGPLYVLPQHQSMKVKPGLSSFALNPEQAGPSLTQLVDFIKTQVPESMWVDTPVWLKATAGLRLLDKSSSDKILSSVRDFLSNPTHSPFYFKPTYAQIISGTS